MLFETYGYHRALAETGFLTFDSISPRTVETHIDALKVITNSSSRIELVSKCISQGMINIFPEHLL